MRKRTPALILALLLAVTLVLTACGGSASSSAAPAAEASSAAPASEDAAEPASEPASEAEAETPAAASGKKYAVFIAQNSNAFTMSVGEAAKAHGESLGHEMSIFDAKYDQGTQTSQIETCITQGYDGLIIEPVSGDGPIPVIQQAKEAGIPVVTIIQELNDQSVADAFVGPDHYEASVIEAEAAFEAIGGKGKVCILRGGLGSSAETLINEAFHAVLDKYPDIELIEEQTANWLIEEGLTVTETWLQKHSDIDAILGESDAMAMGAMKACQDMGIGDIIIVGRDANPETLEAIAAGTFYATIYQNGPQIGILAVDAIDTILGGGTVEPVIGTKNTLVTADNLETYMDE